MVINFSHFRICKHYSRRAVAFPPHSIDHSLLFLPRFLVHDACHDGRGICTETDSLIVECAPWGETAYLYAWGMPWRLKRGGGNSLKLLWGAGRSMLGGANDWLVGSCGIMYWRIASTSCPHVVLRVLKQLITYTPSISCIDVRSLEMGSVLSGSNWKSTMPINN